MYEPGGLLNDIRDRVKEFMVKHNEEFPAKKVAQYYLEDKPECLDGIHVSHNSSLLTDVAATCTSAQSTDTSKWGSRAETAYRTVLGLCISQI